MRFLTTIFKSNTKKGNGDPLERLKRIEKGQRKYGGYVQIVGKVKALKNKGQNKKAIKLLLSAVELVEKESNYIGHDWGVAPWYYEQLAILYRKEKDYRNEVKILERYTRQVEAPGQGPQKLAKRLVKAKGLLEKNA